MCLRRAPEKYITGAMAPVGAALDRADVNSQKCTCLCSFHCTRTRTLHVTTASVLVTAFLSIFLKLFNLHGKDARMQNNGKKGIRL
jgi:hypothetical protein